MDIPRIIIELERLGLTQDQIATAAGVAQPQISRWKNGVSVPMTINRDKLLRYAAKKGVIESPEGMEQNTVPVVGYVGATTGEVILYQEGQGPFGEARMPPRGTRRTVAVRVSGNSMAPMLEDGWTVYYEDRREPPTDDLFGKTCVVSLTDGRVLIKRLHRGVDGAHYILTSLDPSQGPIAADVSWAARVTFIEPK
jgi:phage repressor protein C with HTH and peptisase S24 domain